MKRRGVRERDEAIAHQQAEHRTEALLDQLKAQEAAARERPVEDAAVPLAEPDEDEPRPPADEPI